MEKYILSYSREKNIIIKVKPQLTNHIFYFVGIAEFTSWKILSFGLEKLLTGHFGYKTKWLGPIWIGEKVTKGAKLLCVTN